MGMGSEVTTTTRRRLPLVVRWMLYLGAAALGSVLVGFVVGLARPRVKGPSA